MTSERPIGPIDTSLSRTSTTPVDSTASRSLSVLVVVVTFNSSADVGGLLECLPAALGDLPGTVAVVDNASTDETMAVVARTEPSASGHQLGANRGYAAGINAGVAAHPNHDVIIALNADVRLEADTIPPLVDALAQPGVGIVAPRLVDGSGRLVLSIRREDTVSGCWLEAVLGGRASGRLGSLSQVVTNESAYREPCRVDWASGPVMLFSRQCFDLLGGWDETFFLYSEETDFCLRARDAGLSTLYIPSVTATHFGGESTRSGFLWSLLTHNRHRLFRRRNGRIRTGLHWLALVVREGLRMRDPVHARALQDLLHPTRLRREVRQRQIGRASSEGHME